MALNKVIIVGSNKGGVGKTTSVAALADSLSRKLKHSVLVVDTDPQGNLSNTLGYRPSQKIPNSLVTYLSAQYLSTTGAHDENHPIDYYINKARKYVPRSDILHDYDSLDIMPSNAGLVGVYKIFTANSSECALIFREMFNKIRALDKYDFILVDTRPVIDEILTHIMLGADYLLVPSTDDMHSFMGANSISAAYTQVHNKRESLGDATNIELLGMFLNMIKLNTKIERATRGEGISHFWGDKPIFETRIKQNQDVKNAGFIPAPVTAAYPSCIASAGFNALAREVVSKIG